MNRREEYAMHMPEYVYVSGRNETDDIYNPITDGWMDELAKTETETETGP